MAPSKMNPKVDGYMRKLKQWKDEFELLRAIVLSCGELTEEVKWMHPCYTLDNKNIVLIHGFKEYCALLFHKGALMKDPEGILIQQTENVQAARQIRFTSATQIAAMEDTLKTYILEAIAVENAGLEVPMKKHEDYNVPEELHMKFEEIPGLKAAFEGLTPGRQRAYILFFSDAKQAKTRIARVEKMVPQILEGKGLND